MESFQYSWPIHKGGLMKNSIPAILFAVEVFCFAGSAVAQADLPKPGASHTTYLPHGIWTWFGDPKAIYFKGVHEKTYVSFFDITTNPGNVLVSSYDHATKKIDSYLVATNFGYDDHNHPSILV